MEEKKRKKAKKKNKGTQPENAQQQASPDLEGGFSFSPPHPPPPPPSALLGNRQLEFTLSNGRTSAQPAAVVEGDQEQVEISLACDHTSGQKEAEARPSEALEVADRATRDLRKEFELLVQDLRSSLHTETVTSQVLLNDLKYSISGLQASVESPVKKLSEELLQLNGSIQEQRKKEVDLDGLVINIKEEFCHLKALQERQQASEAAKPLELQQLREEIGSLREYCVQQFEKVEEMSMAIKQLLLERSPTATGSTDRCTQVLAVRSSSQESPLEQLIEMSGSVGEPAEHGGSASMILGEANGNHGVVNNEYLDSVTYKMVPEVAVPGMGGQAGAPVDGGPYIKEFPAMVENCIIGQPIDDGPLSHDHSDVYGVIVNERDTQQGPQHISSPLHHQHGPPSPEDLKPFSDAPITGAPLRLFGFIARYVSGADLIRS